MRAIGTESADKGRTTRIWAVLIEPNSTRSACFAVGRSPRFRGQHHMAVQLTAQELAYDFDRLGHTLNRPERGRLLTLSLACP